MTKKELIALLRDAQTAITEALYGETAAPIATMEAISNALRAEAALGADGVCPMCGDPVTQPATGRPRTYCGGACKKRAQRARQAA